MQYIAELSVMHSLQELSCIESYTAHTHRVIWTKVHAIKFHSFKYLYIIKSRFVPPILVSPMFSTVLSSPVFRSHVEAVERVLGVAFEPHYQNDRLDVRGCCVAWKRY